MMAFAKQGFALSLGRGTIAMSVSNAPSRPARLTAFAVVALLSASAETSAQQPSQAQINTVRSACRSDYMAHCASIPPGGKAALACLQKNVASLSTNCQNAVNAMGGGGTAPAPSSQGAAPAPVATPAETAPAAPASPPAATAAPAPQPTAPAAAAPGPAAPPPAAAAPAYPPLSPRQEMAVLRWSCGRDVRALCAGVPPGGGRIVACLRAKAPYLSQQCRRALMTARRQ
jgi:cysteine rich repeat protein